MVDVVGHLGMALIWLAPAWFFIDRPKTGATFIAVGTVFGLLPDIDLYLRLVFPTLKHHGVLHTVLFVTVFAAVAGPLLGWILDRALGGSDWFSEAAARRSTAVGFIAVWVAGLSHLFADMLSAPDIAEAIEPFWPIYPQAIGIDLVWYSATWFNWGLLIVGLLVNGALWYWADSPDERRRRRDSPT